MDNHRLVLMMRDYEEMREQNKTSIILDEKSVHRVRVKKDGEVFF